VDEDQTPGWKEVEWNAEKNPSGIYLYTVRIGTVSETKKMMLMR
jgi:hypothetical protein